MKAKDIIKEMERKINYYGRRITECLHKALESTNPEEYRIFQDWASDYTQERYAVASIYAYATEQEYSKVLARLDEIGE